MDTTTASFNIMYGVGRSRHIVNYHDGVKTHSDGSPFFDIAIFSNQRKLNAFVSRLRRSGYGEAQEAFADFDCAAIEVEQATATVRS